MSACQSLFFLLTTFFVLSLVQCTEFVPCYIWSNKRTSDRVPALNKISQDIFKEGIQKHLKDDSVDLIAIFAEQTLSPEDFAQHDESGVIFSNLAKLAKTTKVSYLPYVQNPIKALKHLDATVTEVPLDKLGKGFEIPDTDILVVNLNDAKDNENRNDMLKRHDSDISLIYQELENSHKNILCIYTAHHTSWVASEEVQSRQRRSLLEAEDPTPVPANEAQPKSVGEPKLEPKAGDEPLTPVGDNFYVGTKCLLYTTSIKYTYLNKNYNVSSVSFSMDTKNASYYTLSATITGEHTIQLSMTFTSATSSGYWDMLTKVPATITNSTTEPATEIILSSGAPIVAPNTFSFHCGDQIMVNTPLKVVFKNFQIQVYFTKNAPVIQKFNDAYDCVGFTSVPIWSGIFVTTILLIIMTIGITMIMDIRTMDKFDDAKGKTITINAE